MAPTPRLSHLQFLVLGTLLHGPRTGREVREELGRFGVHRTGPAFYQLMSRLEEAELVEGSYRQREVAGQKVRERAYRLLTDGRAAWNENRDFTESVIAAFGESRG